MTEFVATCSAQHVQPDGSCAVLVWTEKPQPVFPALTLAEGAAVAFAIVGVWTVGVTFRVYVRATRT